MRTDQKEHARRQVRAVAALPIQRLVALWRLYPGKLGKGFRERLVERLLEARGLLTGMEVFRLGQNLRWEPWAAREILGWPGFPFPGWAGLVPPGDRVTWYGWMDPATLTMRVRIWGEDSLLQEAMWPGWRDAG